MEELTCAGCSKLVNKILAMECGHNLCVVCGGQAVEQYKRSNSGNKQERSRSGEVEVECQICGRVSNVHQSAYIQLVPVDGVKRSRAAEFKKMEWVYQNPEVESMLFCLDCEKNCFSIDDYLNGTHSGHNVKNVKRSESILKQLLGQLDSSVKQTIQATLTESSKLIQRKRDLIQNFSSIKKTIKHHFQKTKTLLQQKQTQLINTTQELMVRLFSRIDCSIVEVKNRLNQYEIIHQQLQDNLKLQNKVLGFNYYSNRKQGILQQLSYPIRSLSQETLESVRCVYVNSSVLEDTYESIKRMKLVFGEVQNPVGMGCTNHIQNNTDIIQDFFQAKKNQVFNQTTKKDFKDFNFKNRTLNTVKSAEILKPHQGQGVKNERRGVNERLRELEILISRPSQQGFKRKMIGDRLIL